MPGPSESTTSRPPRLPVVVVGGYLGAGKTTLINHLLRHAGGRRLAVLVNDFGSINIDADLIAADATNTGVDSSANVLALTGGCLCCSFGDDLVGTLTALTRRTPPPDVALIELSGVAMPATVVRTARLALGVELTATLVLADAEQVQAQAADLYVGDTVRQQLLDADWLLLNKADLVAADTLQARAQWLQTAAPQARLWAGAAEDVLPELLLGWQQEVAIGAASTLSPATWPAAEVAPDVGRPLQAWRHTKSTHAKTVFDSCSFELPATADLQALGAALAADGTGVLRAKGLCAGQVLQVTGRRWAVTPSALSGPGRLVVIGLRGFWDAAAVGKLLQPESPLARPVQSA